MTQPPSPAQPPTTPREIATLPPLEELRDDVPLSPRTGEPRRPATVLVAAVVGYVAVAVVALTYGWHWYRAAYSQTYPISAHLTQWVQPEPGRWLSLTLEFVYTALTGLTAASAGVVGYHAWQGQRWTRWGGGVALALAALSATLVNLYGLISVAFAAILWLLLLLPPTTRYFALWQRVREQAPTPYRRPDHIVYGRLPKYR